MDNISPLDYELLDGEVLTLKDKMVKARKTGLCDHCMGEIKSGTHYRYMVCKLDGAIDSLKYCEDCCAAMVRELEDKGENKWLSERFKKYQKDYIECQFDIPMAEYPPFTECQFDIPMAEYPPFTEKELELIRKAGRPIWL